MTLFVTNVRRSLLLSRVRTSSPMIAAIPRTFITSSQHFKKAQEWDATLATESEADVKADRSPMPKDISQLQKESAERAHKERVSSSFMEKTEQLGKKLGKVGEKIGEESEEAVEELSGIAHKAGSKLGKVAGKVENVEESVKDGVSNLVDSVKKKIKNATK